MVLLWGPVFPPVIGGGGPRTLTSLITLCPAQVLGMPKEDRQQEEGNHRLSLCPGETSASYWSGKGSLRHTGLKRSLRTHGLDCDFCAGASGMSHLCSYPPPLKQPSPTWRFHLMSPASPLWQLGLRLACSLCGSGTCAGHKVLREDERAGGWGVGWQ